MKIRRPAVPRSAPASATSIRSTLRAKLRGPALGVGPGLANPDDPRRARRRLHATGRDSCPPGSQRAAGDIHDIEDRGHRRRADDVHHTGGGADTERLGGYGVKFFGQALEPFAPEILDALFGGFAGYRACVKATVEGLAAERLYDPRVESAKETAARARSLFP